MLWFCMINQPPRSRLYRTLPGNCWSLLSVPISFATAGIHPRMLWRHSVRGVPGHRCSKDKPHHFPSQGKNVHLGLCFPPAYPLPVRPPSMPGSQQKHERHLKCVPGTLGCGGIHPPKQGEAGVRPVSALFLPRDPAVLA